MQSYISLHNHSQFSLLDGIIQLQPLAERCAKLGMEAVALTDHGVLHGAITFYKACKSVGIKPIIGAELYVSDNPDDAPKEELIRDNYHLTVMACSLIGYKNLIRILSFANQHNFYYKPRASKAMLTKHSEGLIALSGCLGGEVSSKINWEQNGTEFIKEPAAKAALEVIEWHKNLFGDRYFLEVQDEENGPEQKLLNGLLKDVSKNQKIPLVFTSDAHYLNKEDQPLHEIILCLQLKKTLAEYRSNNEMKFSSTAYLRTPEEMLTAAKNHGFEEAYFNTLLINEMCENYNPGLGISRIPRFDYKSAPDYKEFLLWDQKQK